MQGYPVADAISLGEMTPSDHSLELYSWVRRNKVEQVRSLLETGMDMNILDDDGNTPLHIACLYGRPEIARLLLDAGADTEVHNRWGYTPLDWACLYQETDIVRLLLEHGADVNAQDDYGRGPLDRIMIMQDDDPAREEILDLFREFHPDLVMEAYCSQNPGVM